MYTKLMVFVFLLITPFQSFAGKKQCKPYLEKLHKVQSLQKSGYSNKRGRSLAAREAKARDQWWKCEQGKLPKKSKKKITKKKAPTKRAFVVPKGEYYAKPITNKLVIKSAFKGEQQQAWLDFYQQPEVCRKPNSTKQFAYCMEHRQQQQNLFKHQLDNKLAN